MFTFFRFHANQMSEPSESRVDHLDSHLKQMSRFILDSHAIKICLPI